MLALLSTTSGKIAGISILNFHLHPPLGQFSLLSAMYAFICVCGCVIMHVPNVYTFESLITPIYKGPRKKLSIKKDSLQKSYERQVISEFAILAQKWSKIAPRKKIVFGSLQTILLYIVGELAGGGHNVSP